MALETVLDSIVVSAGLFGSIYLFHSALIVLSKKWLRHEHERASLLELLDWSVLILSGTFIVYNTREAFRILNIY